MYMKKMKKNMTTWIAILLIVPFLGTSKINALEYNNRLSNINIERNTSYSKKLIETYIEENKLYFDNVSKAIDKSQQMQEILFNDSLDNISNYPDYIGGSYIDDNGNYTIQIVKSNVPSKKGENFSSYKKIIDLESIRIEYVENSLNELNKLNNKIISYFSQNKNNIGLIANYVDINKNSVIIELEDTSTEVIERFKKDVIDSSHISFIKEEEKITTADLNPGQSLESLIQCSVGFRAKRNNKVGYVTAGHCLSDQ